MKTYLLTAFIAVFLIVSLTSYRNSSKIKQNPEEITWESIGEKHNEILSKWIKHNDKLTMDNLKTTVFEELEGFIKKEDFDKAVAIAKPQNSYQFYKDNARKLISEALYIELDKISTEMINHTNTCSNISTLIDLVKKYKSMKTSYSTSETNIRIGFLSILEASVTFWGPTDKGGEGNLPPTIYALGGDWRWHLYKGFLSDCWGMVCGGWSPPTALAGGAAASGGYAIGCL